MKKKTAVVLAVLTAGALIGSCVLGNIGYHVFAKGEEDFRIDGSTLTAYLGDDTFVSIPDYVTTIGKGAFAKNATLQSIELPKNLETIDYNAFGDCTALKSITLPKTVTKVGPGAFKGCTSLDSVEIGSNVSSWGSGVFNECTSLEKLILDEDNLYLSYYNGALYNGNMTFLYQVLPGRKGENYVMPEEVEEMDTYAFWGMKELKNVLLSENISQIPAFSMSNMGSVENVILPSSVTSISEKAFSQNSSLKQVMIPDETKDIHEKAFQNCPNVKLLVNKGSSAEGYGKDHKLTVIYEAEYPIDFVDSNTYLEEKPPKTVTVTKKTKITENKEETKKNTEEENSTEVSGDGNIYGSPLDEKEEDVIGKTIIVGGKAVVLIGNENQKVYGTPANETKEQETEKDETSEKEDTSGITSEETSQEKKKEEKKDDSDNVSTQIITEKAYYKQNNLTNYEISEKIKEIKRLAFARSGLESIEIPNSVEKIGYGAFYACENLKKVNIPDSVTSIETKAFADTPWLENWLNGENVTGDGSDFLIAGDGILLAYRGNDTKVIIPDGVKQIGSEAFKGHEEIVEVTVPATVTRINADAFRNCSSLETLNGCKGVKTVIRGAFYGTKVDEENLTQ